MLEIKNVSKSYADKRVLHHIDLRLSHGIYALLGSNGAGKSTLMNILCNQLNYEEGSVLYNDKDIRELKQAYYALLGYAPQQQGLYDEFSGERFLTYIALLKNIDRKQIRKEVLRVAELVNMQQHLKQRCGAYSGGMKQRILVAQALLGSPEILLFDEPTAGLDPKERVSLRRVFDSLKEEHTLLIATHVVSDVESIADEVIFLKQGKLIAQGGVDELLLCHPGIASLEGCLHHLPGSIMLKNLYAMELYKLWKNKRFLLFLFLLLLCNIGFLSYETWGQQGAETTAYQKLSTHLQTLSSDERFTYLQGHAHDVELAFVREQIRNLKTQHDPQAEMRIAALRDQFPELDQSGTIPSLYTGDLEAENAFLQPIIKQADTVKRYADFLKEVEQKAKTISAISIFAKEDSFSIRNIEKSKEDYAAMHTVSIDFHLQDALLKALSYPITAVLVMLAIFLFATMVFQQEKLVANDAVWDFILHGFGIPI